MLTREIINNITPKEFTADKFDSDVFYEAKIYFLGIRIWKYKCNKTVTTNYISTGKKRKPGFVDTEKEATSYNQQ
jgi:hypothetical protein